MEIEEIEEKLNKKMDGGDYESYGFFFLFLFISFVQIFDTKFLVTNSNVTIMRPMESWLITYL